VGIAYDDEASDKQSNEESLGTSHLRLWWRHRTLVKCRMLDGCLLGCSSSGEREKMLLRLRDWSHDEELNRTTSCRKQVGWRQIKRSNLDGRGLGETRRLD